MKHNKSSMGMRIDEIDRLNDKEKIFLVYKIFSVWHSGKIENKGKSFLPSEISINNSHDILKVFLECSKLISDDKVNGIVNKFIKLEFYQKLDFMIYLFDIINDIKLVPTIINDKMDFKKLSDEILKYKLCL